MQKNIIVWDLGATKCAAALVSYNAHTQNFVCEKKCIKLLSSVSSLEVLSTEIERELGFKHQNAHAVCVGAAGIYQDGNLNLNKKYPYAMPFLKLAQKFNWPAFDVIHDYALTLCATFTPNICVKKLNNHEGDIFARRVAFGVGSGLGLKDGILLSPGKFWLGTNEMGHIALPQAFSKELLSFEDILSGSGMLRLHKFLYADHDVNTPEELGYLIRNKKALKTLSVFAYYLGLFTSTVQLAFMPAGGIWITGGVIAKHLELFDCEEFLAGINALPAYLSERQNYPLRIIVDDNAVFIGGAWYAVHKIENSALS